MKPPKCSLCSVAHWGLEHVWRDITPLVRDNNVTSSDETPDNNVTQIVRKVGRPAIHASHAARQRAYRQRKGGW